MKSFYITRYTLFLRVNKSDPIVDGNDKYMAADMTGTIMPDEIYTEEEILKQFPNAVSHNNLLDLKEMYNKGQ